MLGRRDPQRTLFDANCLPHRVPPDSFYARLAAVCDRLFHDDDLEALYDPQNGRPSLPPSLLSGVLLLQFYEDVSDQEAAERVLYDLRWKIALHLPLDYAGFDPSSLSVFRKRLAEHAQERYAFDRFLAVARQAGFLPDRVTVLIDTTWVKGAGAVQDTYTLLRKGIRKLLRALGYRTPSKRRGLSPHVQHLLATYLDQDRKAQIDWTDPQQRAAQLKVLVHDAEATVDLALTQSDDPDVRSVGWLLTKILGDDVVTDAHGDPQLGQGTAPDRVISVTDPAMRHGHKSEAQRFDGFKTAVATELASELILDIADLPANHGDGQPLMASVQRIEQTVGLAIERLIADGAYPSGPNLAACATHRPAPIDLVGPVGSGDDRSIGRSAFQIDLAAHTAVCPQGHRARAIQCHSHGRSALQFRFARQTCEACPLFGGCVKGKKSGRTLTADAYERYRQAARQRQCTDEFHTLYRLRSRVERKQAELVRQGLRHTRYLGEAKRHLQRLWTAAVVNLKRLFRLAHQRGRALNTLLTPAG
jgi:transposase